MYWTDFLTLDVTGDDVDGPGVLEVVGTYDVTCVVVTFDVEADVTVVGVTIVDVEGAGPLVVVAWN